MKKQQVVTALFLSLFLLPLITSETLWAKNKGKSKKSAASNSVKVEYVIPSWNNDSTQIDSGSILIRDVKSGRLVQVSLRETAPDSSVYYGYYSVTWMSKKGVLPEIYVLPQKYLQGKSRNFKALIEKKKLKRKPFVLKKEPNGTRILSIFNSKKDALDAYKDHQEKLKKKEEKEISEKQPTPEELRAALEAKRQAAILAEKERLAREAMEKEKERQRLALIEKQKAEERKRKQELLDKAEKERRKKLAEKIAREGLELYKKKEYKKAEKKFVRSLKLDPENTKYYYQYAVTLYKTENYSKALVYFNMSTGPEVNQDEKNYYVGLSYLKIKDYDMAIASFEAVKKGGSPLMSPTAAFYIGRIRFSEEKFKEAKEQFEFVLDMSKDPRLDEQAEEMIEKIARIQQFKKNQETKYLVNGMFGIINDSNILSAPNDVRSNDPTNSGGYRALLMAGFEYRPIYMINHELSAKLTVINMYSYNLNFKQVSKLQKADPLVTTLSVPYKYKGKLLGKNYQFLVSLNGEGVNLDLNGDGVQEPILSSIYLNTSNVFVMNSEWVSTYKLNLRQDNSLTTVTSADDNSDAMKIVFGTNNLFFRDKKKTQAYIIDADFTFNQATGRNSRYSKVDLGFSYMTPSIWKLTTISKLGYYIQNYNERLNSSGTSEKRSDNNLSLNLTGSRPFAPWVTGSAVFNYTLNSSNLDANKYDKYSITISALFNTAF